jgi:hypothetical protein
MNPVPNRHKTQPRWTVHLRRHAVRPLEELTRLASDLRKQVVRP